MVDFDAKLIKCGLFLHVEGQVISEVLSNSEEKTYKPGEVLIHKGSVPPALFIVRNGKVAIYNEDILITELEELSIMGESFLAETTANATAVAVNQVDVIEIKRDDFYWLAVKHPRLVFNIFTINNQRLRSSNEAALNEARSREEKLRKLVDERTAELNATLIELKETQKFRDQFLANMSHEIRTPMNAIVGLTNLLIKSPLNELQAKYLNVIRKSGANLLVIINDILDLAKIEAGKMELEQVSFPLHIVIQNIHTILNLKAEEKGITILANIDPNVPAHVIGDETRLTQVIMNLAGNAIKFTEKGKVELTVTAVGNSGNTHHLKFSIKDSGIGIPADKLGTIFESFGQASADTTRKFGGTGLGLTISRQLVEMHQSELKVESELGVGSNFFFTIAYQEGKLVEETTIDTQANVTEIKGRRILLVEDNEFNQMVAVDTLADLFTDLTVDVAEDGFIALKKLSEQHYDMVLMDIQLPEMDGFETTRKIRTTLPKPINQIKICAMTASVTKERIDECISSGMNDYLMKPFVPADLKEKVIKNILSIT